MMQFKTNLYDKMLLIRNKQMHKFISEARTQKYQLENPKTKAVVISAEKELWEIVRNEWVLTFTQHVNDYFNWWLLGEGPNDVC